MPNDELTLEADCSFVKFLKFDLNLRMGLLIGQKLQKYF